MERKLEEYIDFLTAGLNKGVCNISETEHTKQNYNTNKIHVGFQNFILSGDKHYYAARLLFLSGVCEYAFFSAQQCIELYLKSYLKYKTQIPNDGHDLIHFVQECRKYGGSDTFIFSDRIMTIAKRFNPFYEYSRYPVQKSRPQNGIYAFIYPDDIQPLDYFVFKMRKIIPYPKEMHDILKEGNLGEYNFGRHEIIANELFKFENINFVKKAQNPT